MSFTNVDSYCAMDLGSTGDIARELLDDQALEIEASSGEIQITNITGSVPAFLTPHMGKWYQMHIDGLRRSALDEVDAAMQALGVGDVPGYLLERRLDQINDKQIGEKREALKDHQQRKAAAYARLEEIRSDYQGARNRFRQKRLERNREPKMIGWFYWAAIVFIGIFEAFINFEAFSSLSFMTPAVALGSTVVVAVLLALSSHLHGQFFAEIQHRFGLHRKPGDRWAAWRMLGLASVGLTVVLSAVWYARANYLQDAVMEAAVIGGTPPSWLATVGGSLLMNLGVWIAGVIISYLCHDSDPEFPAAAKAMKLHGDKLDKMDSKLRKEMDDRFQQITAQAEIERNHARGLIAAMENNSDYQEARKQFQRLTGQDAKVLGLLRTYQSSLASRAKDFDLSVVRKDDFESSSTTSMSTAEYASMQAILKYT